MCMEEERGRGGQEDEVCRSCVQKNSGFRSVGEEARKMLIDIEKEV